MSRVGKKPVDIPSGVKVSVDAGNVVVEGPKGKLTKKVAPGVTVAVDDEEVRVSRVDDQRSSRASQGLMRSLVSNMVQGVHKGFDRALVINGVGYRAEVDGKTLTLHLGFSHPVQHAIPDSVEVVVDKFIRVVVRGIDLQAVGQMAAVIRASKSPDPYKGKGVTYEGERIRKKAGKKAVT